MEVRYCAWAMAAKRTMQTAIETVRATGEVVRFMMPPVLLRCCLELNIPAFKRLLKLYKSVLVVPTALIAQAIFRSQARCFQRVSQRRALTILLGGLCEDYAMCGSSALLLGATNAVRGAPGGFADHQFGFDHDLAAL